MYLEISLLVVASRAHFRSLRTYYDMTAVTALPYFHFALLKHSSRLNVVEQCAIALLMTLLDSCYEAEFLCQLVEAFLVSGLRKAFVHIRPFVVLAFCSILKVLCGSANAIMQLFSYAIPIRLIDDQNEIWVETGAFSFWSDYPYFSLIPLDPVTLSIRGAKYELTDRLVEPNKSLTISNEPRGRVEVSFRQGRVIVVLSRDA